MSHALSEVFATYAGSSGERTRALYDRLEALGDIGTIAVNLMRSQKTSSRAKVYRRRSSRGAAYDTKQWAMDNLCRALESGAGGDEITSWGWGTDDKQPVHRHVLYVDLPTGQVSFHTEYRGAGPGYSGAWDGIEGQSADRILRWCARILDTATSPVAA